MKKLSVILILIAVGLIISCSEKHNNNKQIIVLDSLKKIILNKEYYKTGSIMSQCTLIEGKINGIYRKYYENGILDSKGLYLDDNREGYWYKYSEKGVLTHKVFFDDNRAKLSGKYTYNTTSKISNSRLQEKRIAHNINDISFYFINNNKNLFLGSLTYKNNELLNNHCNFYEVEASDTLKLNEKLNIKIKFYTWGKEKIKIALGKFNDKLEFLNPANTDTIDLDTLSTYSFTVKYNKPGLKKIRGLIFPYINYSDDSYEFYAWPLYINIWVK